jgi:hypothetical protein
MTTLSVGSQYIRGRRGWPQCAQYNCRAGGHEIVLFLDSPSRPEVDAARSGEWEFALLVAPPVLVLCYRAGGGIPWSDAPYSIHLVPEAEREPPHTDGLSAESRALLRIILVDAKSGLVQAIRAVSLSPEFTRALHEAITTQLRAPWDERAYDAALARLYEAHPSSEAMVASAQVRTVGGA